MASMSEEWFEKAISDGHINYLEYSKFTDPVVIGIGGFGKVFKYEWRNSELTVALKCLKVDMDTDEESIKDFINEHSGNILIHQKQAKIADFGLSKRINEMSRTSNSIVHGMVAYIEPKCFINLKYKCDNKSDVYSFGVILWEISSGRTPFKSIESGIPLALHISQGNREEPIKDTPSHYIELYKKCWDNEPVNRPETKLILNTLKQLILNETLSRNNPIENRETSKNDQDNTPVNSSEITTSVPLYLPNAPINSSEITTSAPLYLPNVLVSSSEIPTSASVSAKFELLGDGVQSDNLVESLTNSMTNSLNLTAPNLPNLPNSPSFSQRNNNKRVSYFPNLNFNEDLNQSNLLNLSKDSNSQFYEQMMPYDNNNNVQDIGRPLPKRRTKGASDVIYLPGTKNFQQPIYPTKNAGQSQPYHNTNQNLMANNINNDPYASFNAQFMANKPIINAPIQTQQ
ncbi:kinase-like domain-containing protein [Gigaspora margarita]|uniref:Kinase-like domain-containing protein n=1 Tax=Gigaspora margarita TaxID=4874 RepID=A0A8H4EUR6_GIGMA|nr:kinase-like domain-containing protein [Gigaspora margarita]